jgi:hypothetical protein
MHTHLAAHDLLPREHLLDTGSIAADHLVSSRLTHAVELVGPVLADTSWQARSPEGFDVSCCGIDWVAQTVTCPQGHRSRRWTPPQDIQHGGQELIAIQFDPAHGAVCPVRARCPQAKTGPRTMKLRPQQQTRGTPGRPALPDDGGVPGRLCGPSWGGRDPVPGHARIVIASDPLYRAGEDPSAAPPHCHGDEEVRVAAWLVETPRAPTRLSSFAALAGACG